MTYRTAHLDELVEDPHNARLHDMQNLTAIRASLLRFGQVEPLVVQSGTNQVVGGNGRLQVMRALGWETAEVREVDLDAQEAIALGLALNRTAELATWDETMLRAHLKTLSDADFDVGGFALDEKDLKGIDFGMGGEPEKVVGKTDPDDVPEVPQEPITKPGDLWILGDHRLLCGDSTNIQHVERLMDGKKADLLHTDPPYGVDYEGVTNDDLKAEKLRAFIKDALTNAFACLRDGANAYVWHADIHAYEFIGAFRDSGFTQAKPSIIQWVKDSLVLSQGDYHSRNEPCLYGWKPGKNRVRVKDRKQDTIWEYPKPRKADGHPTMKPVDLCRRAICNSSEQQHVVLDLFGGSGSTLIACEQDRRSARLVELNPAYCDVIVKRWEDFTGQKAVRA